MNGCSDQLYSVPQADCPLFISQFGCSTAILRSCQGGPMSPVWMSCVGVYKCFTLRSEIGEKFFVFVAALEKRDRNHYSSSISQLTFRVLNTILVLWFHFMLCCYFLGHVACQTLPWQGLRRVFFIHFLEKAGIDWCITVPAHSENSKSDNCLKTSLFFK